MICYDVHLAFINRQGQREWKDYSDNGRLTLRRAKLTLCQMNFASA